MALSSQLLEPADKSMFNLPFGNKIRHNKYLPVTYPSHIFSEKKNINKG